MTIEELRTFVERRIEEEDRLIDSYDGPNFDAEMQSYHNGMQGAYIEIQKELDLLVLPMYDVMRHILYVCDGEECYDCPLFDDRRGCLPSWPYDRIEEAVKYLEEKNGQ